MIFFMLCAVLCQAIKFSFSQGAVSCGLEPYDGGCGVLQIPPNFDQNFVTADAEVAPWMAIVALPSGQNCAAVIVDKRHVITDTYCLTNQGTTGLPNQPSDDVSILVGRTVLRPSIPECTTQGLIPDIPDSSGRPAIIPYDTWDPARPTENAVAVIRVISDIRFNQFVRPACLPLSTDGFYFDYSSFSAMTYYTAWRDEYTRLMFLTMPLDKDCPSDMDYNNWSMKFEMVNMVCSKSALNCASTAGSPIVADVNGIWRVIGITHTSIGPDCQTGISFWRLAFYRDWLTSVGIVQVEGEVDPRCSSPTYTGDCGMSATAWVPESRRSMTPRIMNGQPATAGQLPWHVNLDVNGGTFQCGGSLIDKNYVLTAAHCLFNEQNVMVAKEQIKVVLGDIDSTIYECHERRVYVSEVFTHPDYDSERMVNDIALLKVTEDVVFDDYIRPICPPPNEHGDDFDYSIYNGQMVVAGWGKPNSNDDDSSSNVLSATDIRVMRDCPNDDPDDPNRVQSPEMICLEMTTGQNICRGDSGGALAVNVDGKWTAIGIVSSGNRECSGETRYRRNSDTNILAFPRISSYLEWITGIISSGTVNPVLPEGLVPVHVEYGILSEVGLYDLKAIFCTVSAEGDIASDGFDCRVADGNTVPMGNVICFDKLIISERDYKDALVERIWDKQVREGDTLVLETLKTALNEKGLNGDEIVKCMGRAYGQETGCRLLTSNPQKYLCNDKYIVSESIHGQISSG